MTSSDLFSFGALLQTLRKRCHLTQQQLAAAMGIHRTTISRWEEGSFLPESKALVLELARHLKLDDQQARQLLEASLTALAPHWSIPFLRNPYFTGREEILSTLHTQLGVEQAVALTQSSALHGLGGVGKTQVALEYAYRHALEYSAVFWIGAEMHSQITASLLHIARVLQLPGRENKDPQRVIAAVRQWLTTHSQWLLIWDNVGDLALLDHFLPATRSGAILLTTRCQILGTVARGLELLPMEHEEGALFLLRRAKVLNAEATGEHLHQFAERMPASSTATADLVTAMGGLPLALDQAGAYLEATRCGLPAYLKLFRTRRAVLLQQRGKGSREHPASVATTFTLALTATMQRHPAVRDLLQVCALLQPDAIPEEVFRQGGEHLGPVLETVCRDPLEWDRVLGIACAYSLLSRQPEAQTLSQHRLVQAVLLDSMSEAEREQWMRRALSALDAVFPEVLSTTAFGTWKQCERLLLHALLCLQHIESAGEALISASLAYKVAQYQCECGQYLGVEALYQRSLRIREQTLGSDHPLVAAVLTGLANLYRGQGRYAEVEPLSLRALQIREQVLGSTHPEVALSLNGLANLYSDLGRYQEVEALRLRSLSIQEQAWGFDHPEVAVSLTNLAVLYRGQSRYLEAEALCQRSLRILEEALGFDDPLVVYPLFILASLSCGQDNYGEAEALYQRSLRIREQTLGSDHPLVAAVFTDLANLYRGQGRYVEAEPLSLRALQIQERALGSDHPLMAPVLNGLANLYRDQGRVVEAEPFYLQALALREQHLGPSHADTAEILHDLALLRQQQGKLDEAIALAERVHAIRLQSLAEAHVDTAEILHDLALFRQQQGNLNEAIALAERAHLIRLQSLGEAHSKTIATQALYTQLVREQRTVKKQASERDREERPDTCSATFQAGESLLPPQRDVDVSSAANGPLQEFLEACCERHPRAWCRSADLWQAYEQWVTEHQERFPLTRRVFAMHLKAQGCRADHTHEARIWRGITVVK